MEQRYKSVLGKELVEALAATGLGNIISINEVNAHDMLTINIGPLEIPQYPIVPVHRFEVINIEVIDNDLPTVYCRKDFPIVPHLNVLSDGSKTLCLFDVSFEDVAYMFNACMFIKRIVYWFEQTARGTLHRPDQPLEPYFPGAQDAIILSPESISTQGNFICLKKILTPYGNLYDQVCFNQFPEGNIYATVQIPIQKLFSENIIRNMPKTLGELDAAFDQPIIDAIKPLLLNIWNVKQTPLYKTLFQQKETALRRCSVLLIIQISLSRSNNDTVEKTCLKAFRISSNFQSLYQAFGYRRNSDGKLLKKVHGTDYLKIPITPYEVLLPYNRITASFFNDPTLSLNINNIYTQIGVGALGSQVANNCIRAGYGCWTYVDPDILSPHNLARHCLGREFIGQNKAHAMQKYANDLIGNDTLPIAEAITGSVFDASFEDQIKSAIQSSNLIVDCSASVAVGRYIGNTLAGKTRSVSFFMNPSGTALVMLLEDANRNICLDTLEMQYYRMLVTNTHLYDHLKSDSRVIYSSTCRGTSLSYPQDNAAMFSGICSKKIKQIENIKDAAVSIWELGESNLSHTYESGDEFLARNINEWQVKISSALLKKLSSQRSSKLPNETGGVLIGNYDYKYKICYIVHSIDSPPDSKEYPCAYIRGSKGLMEQITKIEKVTVGNLTYIGEWHSHPTASTLASPDDMFLLSSISKYTNSYGNPGCMLIIGDSDFSVYLS